METTQPISVALVHRMEVIRMGLGMMLDATGRHRVVHSVDDGSELVRAMEDGSHVDVAVITAGEPALGGCETMKLLTARWPALRVVAVLHAESIAPVLRCFRSGAHGIWFGTDPARKIVSAVDAVHAGGCYHSDYSQQVMLDHPDGLTQEERNRERMLAEIPDTHQRVLRQLCITHDPTAVRLAHDLQMNARTVERYLAELCETFGVPSKLAMLIAAIRLGLVRP